MSRNYSVSLVVVAGVALAWWAVRRDATKELTTVEQPVSRGAPVEHSSPPEPSTTTPRPAAQPEPPLPAPAVVENPPPATIPPQEPAMNAEPKIPAPERSGPVDELKKRFTSEPRASASARVESAIEAHFRRPEVPAGLLESVLCRTTVCRVKTRWSPERAQGFLSATMLLVTEPAGDQAGFDPNVGISLEADPAPDGSRAIDVYVLLSAAEPSEPAP